MSVLPALIVYLISGIYFAVCAMCISPSGASIWMRIQGFIVITVAWPPLVVAAIWVRLRKARRGFA